ncbi:leucine-rich repeat domain-containing protein [Sinomicrobium sp.]
MLALAIFAVIAFSCSKDDGDDGNNGNDENKEDNNPSPDPVDNTPFIKFTTALETGEKIFYFIEADEGNLSDVWIDINNNKKQDDGESFSDAERDGEVYDFTLSSQTVTVYGEITGFLVRGEVTSLDVSKSTELSWLDCGENTLSSLDVSKNVNLKELDCDNNALTIIDISKNVNLEELNCSVNQLVDLDVSKNVNLKRLGCYYNQLTSLDVSKNIELMYLYCYVNELTDLDLSENINLKELNCHHNALTSLEVSNNPALSFLDCYNNQIKLPEMNALLVGLPDRTGMDVGLARINSSDDEEGNYIISSEIVDIIKDNVNWQISEMR